MAGEYRQVLILFIGTMLKQHPIFIPGAVIDGSSMEQYFVSKLGYLGTSRCFRWVAVIGQAASVDTRFAGRV